MEKRCILCRTAIRLLLAAVCLIAAGLTLAGCLDSVARRKAEKTIARMLPDVLGPAESYEVHVRGSASELSRGYLRAVSISGVNVSPRDLPKMARLEASASDVRVDTKAAKVLESGPAVWSGWIGEQVATAILEEKAPLLQDVQVKITPEAIIASGKTTIKGIGPSGSIEVRPSVRHDTLLWMTPVRVSSLGVEMALPDWTKLRIEPIINPVYIVPESPLDIKLTGVSTGQGLLRIDGTMNLQGLTSDAGR